MVYLEDELCGVFPLVYTGKAWVSLPHFSYGGYLQKKDPINSFSADLLTEIISNLHDYDTGFYAYHLTPSNHIETQLPEKAFIRSLKHEAIKDSFKSEKVTSILTLPSEISVFRQSLNSNLRRKINRATKNGFFVKIGSKELLDDFYYVYTQNIRKLKSLSYSKLFFKDLIDTWEYGTIKVFVAFKENIPIGAAITASYSGFYENMYFATINEFRKDYITDFLNWNIVNYCILDLDKSKLNLNMERYYSFGRSTYNSGVYTYKNHWPVFNLDLYSYQNYFDIRKKNWLYFVWGLLPNPITSYLGQRLIKHIY